MFVASPAQDKHNFGNHDEITVLAVMVVIKGNEVPDNIIDGGSRVNVISRRTCDTLGIREWESIPLWIRMADTSSVRPTGLQTNPEPQHHDRRTRVPDLDSSVATKCARGISSIVRQNMAKDDTHQAKLAKEYDNFLA